MPSFTKVAFAASARVLHGAVMEVDADLAEALRLGPPDGRRRSPAGRDRRRTSLALPLLAIAVTSPRSRRRRRRSPPPPEKPPPPPPPPPPNPPKPPDPQPPPPDVGVARGGRRGDAGRITKKRRKRPARTSGVGRPTAPGAARASGRSPCTRPSWPRSRPRRRRKSRRRSRPPGSAGGPARRGRGARARRASRLRGRSPPRAAPSATRGKTNRIIPFFRCAWPGLPRLRARDGVFLERRPVRDRRLRVDEELVRGLFLEVPRAASRAARPRPAR